MSSRTARPLSPTPRLRHTRQPFAHLMLAVVLAVVLAPHIGIGPLCRAQGTQIREDTRSDGSRTRTVRVGMYQNPPKIFIDEAGLPSGIFVDLLDEIARREKWSLVYVPGEWSECLRALEEHRLDLMPDVAYSRERDTKYDFHKTAVVESWSQVYARASTAATALSDLNGRRVAVLKNAIQEEAFVQLMSGFGFVVTIVHVDTYEEGFRVAGNGSVDAVISNHLVGEYLFRRYGLVKTPIVFQPVLLYFATAKGRNPGLLGVINRYLDAWRTEPDSHYYKTLARWMAKPPVPVVPRRVVWFMLFAAGALALSLGVVLLLRAQVRTRTRHLVEAIASLHTSEDEVRRLNAELERRIRERTAQLEETNRELEAFSYSVSHDLRAPLRGMDGFSKVLLDEWGERLDGEGRANLERIRGAAQRMAALIEDLLKLSRLSRQQMERREVDVSQMVTAMAADLSKAAPERSIQWVIQPGVRALADGPLLRIALQNLLANAAKFTRKTPAARIEFSVRDEGAERWFFVKDNGAGFDMTYVDKLFGPFQRLHPASEFEGSGIGLATVQRVVVRHGGRVRGEGAVGRGATFSFTLGEQETHHG